MKIILTLLIMIGGLAGLVVLIMLLSWFLIIWERKCTTLKLEYKWFRTLCKIGSIVVNILAGLFVLFMIFITFMYIYIRL